MLPNGIQLAGRVCSAAHGTSRGEWHHADQQQRLHGFLLWKGFNAVPGDEDWRPQCHLQSQGGLSNRDPSCDKEEEEESFQPLKDSTETEGFPGEEE